MGKKWYVLQVRAGRETLCGRWAAAAGFEAVVPVERARIAMPGYVFVAFSGSTREYYQLLRLPGAVRLLPGRGALESVPEEQMARVLAMKNAPLAQGGASKKEGN